MSEGPPDIDFTGKPAYWTAAVVFTLVGVAFVAVGVAFKIPLTVIGVPILALGLLILAMMLYSVHLRARSPENYDTWLWWVNLIGGLAGVGLFAVPSLFALPVLLLVGGLEEFLWLGAVFSLVGAAVLVIVWFVARRQYRGRPRWVRWEE